MRTRRLGANQLPMSEKHYKDVLLVRLMVFPSYGKDCCLEVIYRKLQHGKQRMNPSLYIPSGRRCVVFPPQNLQATVEFPGSPVFRTWNLHCQGRRFNTGVGCHFLLQGIFPTQGSNPGLLHCRQILYQLNHKGSPRILEWVAYPFSSGFSQPRNQTGVSSLWANSLPTELLKVKVKLLSRV